MQLEHASGKNPYGLWLIKVMLSYVSMYILMYAMVDSPAKSAALSAIVTDIVAHDYKITPHNENAKLLLKLADAA